MLRIRPFLAPIAMLAISLLLVACSSLGFTPPQNEQQQIMYAYSGVTAALNTLASATNAGLLTSSEAAQANAAILTAKGMLDEARATSDQPAAVKLITAATSALATVSAYLVCKEQNKGGASCLLPSS